ncbi:hypothetical protein Riv7116_2735 [Rivularia sp. PCC 7116]|uniref:hypothetical protein n=1 Tax=Rivularia sp. PCC 7116 TaxID=373994 RepID=UPI00029F1885|nr:hypothetical protein [Rivularia sp. PCC 7116]AFY55238.1 hypothetical protein Riv7116_2735 [Rivularia sp. PCC 7116]
MASQNNKQPLTPEQVDFEQKNQQKQELENADKPNVLNPGDKVNESKSLDEKAQQVAVDAPDITGDRVTVPTYFVTEDKETGEEEALHHVKDAEKISDTIRQARVDEDGNREWR